ncbi:MAG: hypothetical protein RJA99_1449 [Pseudomonadota bacterium]|jgi:tripartite-type tricarboxylate transporter receptor subunit TctC
MDRRRALALAAGAVLAASASRSDDAAAQQPQAGGRWPDRPVRLIVPYSAGGGGDTLARQLAPRLAERLGVAVNVENRPGAGGNLGTEGGLKAAPDGTTLVAISASYPCQAVISKLSFDPLVDYTPISLLSREPGVLLVNPDFPAKTLREFVALAKAKPGALAYGSAGLGSQAHFNTEWMAFLAGVKLNHVPYKGTSQAFTDLLGGNIQTMFATPQFAVPLHRSGRTRVLAVAGTERLASLPDVPTFAEQGLAFEFWAWNGLIAPRDLPTGIAARLNAEVNAVLGSREVNEKLAADGVGAVGGAPERLSALIRQDVERWREIAQRAQIKAE